MHRCHSGRALASSVLVLFAALLLCVPAGAKGKKKGGKKTDPKSDASVEERLERLRERIRADQAELDAILEARRKEREALLRAQGAGGLSPEQAAQINQALKAAHALALQSQAIAKRLQEKLQALDEFDERIGGLESDLREVMVFQDKLLKESKTNKLKWSGSYRAVVNNFHLVDHTVDNNLSHLDLVLDDFGQPIYDPATDSLMVRPVYVPTRRQVDRWYGSQWVNRLRLSMVYDVSDKVRFYGQMSVFKYFNEIKIHSPTLDMHTNRYPRDNSLRIERAYFDWFMTDWLVLTVGRVASPEGPPAELKENTVRNATWGVQMVEAEMEAVLLTFHFSKYLENTFLRIFYIPFATHMDFALSDDTKLFSYDRIKEMHSFGAMLEMKVPGLGDNLLQLGFVTVPKFRPRNVPIDVPGVGKIYPDDPTGQDLGTYWAANGLIEFKDIGGIGLDLFAAYSATILQPREDRIVYGVPLHLEVRHPVSGQVVSTVDTINPLEIGLASYEEGNNTTNVGHMFYVGFRYTLPVFGAFAPRFGAEMNRGTKYHVPWASASDLLVNRLATKGWAWEVYYIQQLVENQLFARIGYVQLIREYEGLYIGPTVPIDQTIDNAYILIDAKW